LFCFVLFCFVCFLADFWDGHTASIGSFYVYTYFLYQTKKKCNCICFCRCRGRGGLFRQKRISGRLESTPKLIELKHFKKSNSSRNDTINAVEGSDEMNQWKWIYNVSNEIMTLKIRDQFVRAAARLHRRITQGGYLQFVHL